MSITRRLAAPTALPPADAGEAAQRERAAPGPHAAAQRGVPDPWDTAACTLWPLAVRAAARGHLLPPAEAEAALADPDLEAVDKACAALQAWCWMRGMPPLDRVVSHPRVKGALREVAPYDVFFEAMGVVITGERYVHAYPWRKVPEPSPVDISWARSALGAHEATLKRHRFLDLELELREANAARGRTRPVPPGCATWAEAEQRRSETLADLASNGIAAASLRPPGSAPYPPPPPRESSYSH